MRRRCALLCNLLLACSHALVAPPKPLQPLHSRRAAAAVDASAAAATTGDAATPADANGVTSTTSDANAVAAPASSGAANGHQRKTAAVFGFFGASDRELALIEKRYAKNGYECVVVPSPVKEVARPSGWYKNFRRNARLGKDHELARHFDVVHCMSGGFLNYYLTRGAGVPLACDTLLLDSTPILPKPRAFTTFARQFMRDALPFGKVVDLFPQPLHLFLIRTRWSVTAFRLRVQHWFLRRLGRHPRAWRDLTTRWLRVSSSAARRGNYEPIVAHAARVAFGRAPAAPPPKRAVFLHNPADPYLSRDDVLATVGAAERLGLAADVHEVATNHVQTIFQKPRIIFEGALA